MRHLHFKTIAPICPRCRIDRSIDSSLVIANIITEEGDHIVEGILHCSDESCQIEYPIIDGIPILVPDIRTFITDQWPQLNARKDLSATMRSLLADGAGSDSALEITRQHLSTYAWDHYSQFDPDEPQASLSPGSIARCLSEGLKLFDAGVSGPAIDLGCSTGRTTFELAAHAGDLVLGIDLSFPMLQLAGEVLRNGTVQYERRTGGLVYEPRSFRVEFPGSDRVDFWLCDAMCLPFRDDGFTFGLGLNLLDSVVSPIGLLQTLARIIKPTGQMLLGCPYDWSTTATPVEAWIGGHSQRGGHAGSSETLLRSLLTPGGHPQSLENMEIIREAEHVSWQVRTHDRCLVKYDLHMIAARRKKA